eukprot:1921147-Rhodomonas_salina.1
MQDALARTRSGGHVLGSGWHVLGSGWVHEQHHRRHALAVGQDQEATALMLQQLATQVLQTLSLSRARARALALRSLRLILS